MYVLTKKLEKKHSKEQNKGLVELEPLSSGKPLTTMPTKSNQ